MMVFPEEQALLNVLLKEWYEGIAEFTRQADAIFDERGKHLDRHSPPWMRHDFPEGYAHEIGKKNSRIKQFLSCDPVPWDKILDELIDVTNYSRMMASEIRMLQRRQKAVEFKEKLDKVRRECCGDGEVRVVVHHCGPDYDCGGKGVPLRPGDHGAHGKGETATPDVPRPAIEPLSL